MSANVFGERFRIMTFGESHGPALGVVIDGCPAGLCVDLELIKKNLERRRPGQKGQIVSPRNEKDEVEILSGVFEGKTLGTPLAMIVRNLDARSEDYHALQKQNRAGHADDVWGLKFGHRDYRGGGRSSGRETLSRVLAGSVAQMLCSQRVPGCRIFAYTSEAAHLKIDPSEESQINPDLIDQYVGRFPTKGEKDLEVLLEKAVQEGNSYGGVATIRIQGFPPGLGQPVFHKLKSDLAQAFMSIGAVNGVELGKGFGSLHQEGQVFHRGHSEVYGGIRGGLSTGEDIVFRVSVKPTSSILDVAKKGRHDPFILTRAIPVFEAMAWLVMADHLMWQRTDRIEFEP